MIRNKERDRKMYIKGFNDGLLKLIETVLAVPTTKKVKKDMIQTFDMLLNMLKR